MLKFSKTDDCLQTQCMPNILPCRIHHEGPVDASPRYWAPEIAQGQSTFVSRLCSSSKTNLKNVVIDGKLESYFRGRKLRGQEVDLPQGYRGVIVKEAGKEKTALQSHDKGDLEGEKAEEEQEEATLLEEVGSFEKMVIWNHESMVNGDDAFVKGVSEWIDFAEAVSHVFSSHTQSP